MIRTKLDAEKGSDPNSRNGSIGALHYWGRTPFRRQFDSECDWMPWAWCNLSRNPFGELTREERAELAVVNVDRIADEVRDDHSAVQFIGACGRGKTTRMLVLHQKLADSTYAYLPEDGPCPPIAAGRPVLIDEAQRLRRRVRSTLFASGLPLVLATHRDLTRSLRKHSYNVVTIEIGHENSPALICEAMNRRIEASRLDDGAIPKLSLNEAAYLVNRFGSDVRAIENYLYDVVQAQVFQSRDLDHGQMRFID